MQQHAGEKRHSFSPDRPILHRAEDKLGRASFAESIAKAIAGWREKDSLVLALYGGWGSGKTSVKNMILEALRADGSTAVYPVDFNPWEWSNQNGLLEAFFQEVGAALGKIPGEEAGKLRRQQRKWKAYAAYLRVGSTLAGAIRKLLTTGLALLGVGLLAPGALGTETAVLVPAGVIILIVSALVEFSDIGSKFADYLSEAFGAAVADKALRQLKEELSKVISETEKTILVIIDDIDRLHPMQISAMFQLVKVNADFSGMVYLLLFDRGAVEKALNDQYGVPDFLEKIVQVGFDMPQVERKRLERVLFTELDRILSSVAPGERFQQERWAGVFPEGVRPYFKNIRDVRRLVASLEFHTSLLSSTGTLEVNPVDLIAIDVLRVFDQRFYQSLPSFRALLTGNDPYLQYGIDKDSELKRKDFETLISLSRDNTRSAAKNIISVLFPEVDGLFGGWESDHSGRESWAKELRICSHNFFDRYFQLSIPEGDISQNELDLILSMAGDRRQLVEKFHDLKNRNLLEALMDRLEAYKQEIDIAHALPFVTAMFDAGDLLREQNPGFLEIDPTTHASRVVTWYLRQETASAKRGEILLQAVIDTVGLYLPIHVISIEEQRRERKDESDCLVSDEQLGQLKRLIVKKIEAAANMGTLREHRDLMRILYTWQRWDGSGRSAPAEKWVASLVSTPDGIIHFLVAATQPYSVNGQQRWKVRLKNIEDFVDLSTISDAVAKGFDGPLADEETRAVKEFQKAMKRRAEGKADDGWSDDED